MNKKLSKIGLIPSVKLAVLLWVMLPLHTFSQDSNFGNWFIYIGNKKLNDKWNVHNEIQYRNYNVIGDLEQLLLRTGLGYSINSNSNILLGYSYIISENYMADTDEKYSIDEHRIFEQLTTKQNIGIVGLTHRYRFEQRFIENDFKMRFRYFLSVNIPINKKEMVSKTYYISTYNEVFLNTESSFFDRNRIYTGLGYKLNNNINFELGYMNQLFEENSRDQLNLILFVNL